MAPLGHLNESLTTIQQERLEYKTRAEQATLQFDKLVAQLQTTKLKQNNIK